MNTFTIIQILAIWGNFMAFYAINCVLSAIPSFGMYAIIFRLCRQPAYWATILIVAIGMGPVFALKYLRYTYRPNAINILQQAERSRSPVFSIGSLESQLKSFENDAASLSVPQAKLRSSVHVPLLSDSTTASRRSTFDFLQPPQSRISSSYARNLKSN